MKLSFTQSSLDGIFIIGTDKIKVPLAQYFASCIMRFLDNNLEDVSLKFDWRSREKTSQSFCLVV